MEYPGAKWTRPLRVGLLALFILAFLIISPTVIMYSAGYRYDWKYGFLKETGSISVDVTPKNIAMYLDGLKLKDRLPVRLNNIAPHKYQLLLTAPGYHSWQKEIEVKSKETTYIKEIRLLKKEQPEFLVRAKIGLLSLSPDGRYLAYTREDRPAATEVWLRDNKNGTEREITTLPFAAPVAVWSPGSDYVVLTNKEAPYSTMLLIDPLRPTQALVNQDNFPEPITKLQWKNNAASELYVGTAATVYLVAPATKQTTPLIEQRYVDWYMDNGELWTIQINTSSKQYIIIKDTLGFNSEFARLDFTQGLNNNEGVPPKLRWAEKDHALLEIDGKLTLLLPEKRFTIPAEHSERSPYGRWWLFWSPWELWTYAEGEEPKLLTRSAKPLRGVAPLDEFNTLALLEEEKAYALFPYYFISHDLVSNKVAALAVDSKKRFLYFTDKRGLWKLEY